MPRVVDHEARRQELVDALLRIVVRDGTDAVSIRTVAAEAGCSIRPVQYYFDNKAALLAAAHARVSERMAALVTKAVTALGPDPSPRDVVTALVHAFLPTTGEARDSIIAYHCFHAAELTNPTLRVPGASDTTTGLARVIRRQVERRRGEDLPEETGRDIDLLVTTISTISSSVIAGYRSLESATALLDHQIDRLMRGGPPQSEQATAVVDARLSQ